MTPAELDRTIEDLIDWESIVPHMYLDTRGNVTVAIGHLVKDATAADALEFWAPGMTQLATEVQVRADFARVVRAGQTTGKDPRRPAGFYRSRTSPSLKPAYMRELARRRLEGEFLPALRRLMPGFDGYPWPVRRCLLDLAWNLGTAGIARFGGLIDCCRDRDWMAAAGECHVSSSRPARNAWRAARFTEAARDTAEGLVIA